MSEKQIQRLETLSSIGKEACDAKRFKACLRAFEQAQEILPWAPHEYYIAEAEVGMGLWVEGTELWAKILRDNDPDAPHPSVREAVRAARERLNQVRDKIPSVTIQLPTEVVEAQVRWDGEELTTGKLGPFRVNPGTHQLEVNARGYKRYRSTRQVKAGSQQTLRVTLEPDPQDEVPPAELEPAPDWMRPWGVGLGIAGVVALGTASATWFSKEDRRKSLSEDCDFPTDRRCPDNLVSKAEFDRRNAAIEDLTTVSNILFVGGGVLAVAGVSLLLWPTDEETEETTAVNSWVLPGGGFVSVSGKF